jgi:hypothetical protein
MTLKRTLEKAEFASLDAGLRSAYVERDGKYVLDADDSPMLTALEQERAAKKQLEAKLAGYGDLTPEQVKALTDAKAKAERQRDLDSGNFDKIVAEMNAKHAKDLELRDQGEARLRSTLESALIDAEATRALVGLKGNPDLLLPVIKARAKLQTVGDREVAVIIGEKGGPLLKAGAKGADDFMDMTEYVGTLKADKRYAGAFESGVGSGSGGTRNGATAPVGTARGPQYTGKIAEAMKAGATILTKDIQ